MTLPKGFESSERSQDDRSKGGYTTSGASREEIERMIGRRVENMRGILYQ